MIIGAHIVAPGKSGPAYGSADSRCVRVADVVKSVRRECENTGSHQQEYPQSGDVSQTEIIELAHTPDAPSATVAALAIVLAPACSVSLARTRTKPLGGQHAMSIRRNYDLAGRLSTDELI